MPQSRKKKNKHTQSKGAQTIRNFFRPRWALLLIVLATTAVFLNTFQNGLTNWDDDQYVGKNPYIRELSAENLQAIFFGDARFYMGNYHPLTMLSLAIDFQLSDKELDREKDIYNVGAFGFHLTNLLLHLLTTVLVFFVSLRLGKKFLPGHALGLAFVAGLWFGIHTLHVESVSWVSERKDVLYAAGYFGAFLLYLRYLGTQKASFFWGALGLFVLALLAKGQAVSLAVTLVILDVFYNRRVFSSRVMLEKLPFFALALFFGLLAVEAQTATEAIHKHKEFLFSERLTYAAYALTQYIIKLFAPLGLSAIYPYQYASGNLPGFLYLFYLTPLALAGILWKTWRKHPLVALGILFFLGNIVFLLQILPVGNAVMADRYAYVPSFGFFVAVAAAAIALARQHPGARKGLWLLFVGYSAFLSYHTIERNKVWQDSLSLWNDIIEKQPSATVAYNNRGSTLRGLDRYKAAISDFAKAASQDTTYTHAIYNLGTTQKDYAETLSNPEARQKHLQKAIENLSIAIQQDREFVEAYHNRGLCYDLLGQVRRALKDFDRAVSYSPSDYKIYVNRGVARGKMGDLQGAVADFERALQQEPKQADALSNRGLAYSKMKQYDKAVRDFSRAIQVKPGFANAYFNRGLLYFQQKKYEKALQDLNRATQLMPRSGRVFYQRAILYINTNRKDLACADLKKAIKLGFEPAKRYFQAYCVKAKQN